MIMDDTKELNKEKDMMSLFNELKSSKKESEESSEMLLDSKNSVNLKTFEEIILEKEDEVMESERATEKTKIKKNLM